MSQELICVPVILKTPAQADIFEFVSFNSDTITVYVNIKKSMIFPNIPSPEFNSIVKSTLIHCNSDILGLYVEKEEKN